MSRGEWRSGGEWSGGVRVEESGVEVRGVSGGSEGEWRGLESE